MAQQMKNLLKISMAIRNLGSFTNYTMTKRFIRMSVRCTTNYTKETLVSPQPLLKSDTPQELLSTMSVQEALRKSRLSTHVFSIIESNHQTMTVKDAVTALDVLVVLEKGVSQSSPKMYENTAFLMLCEILNKKARNMEPYACVTALKAMVYFQVPTTSVIVQVILQMLRHSMDQLSLSQMSFLHFMLKKCDRTPLVDALTVALPIVYEANVLTKLDRENIQNIKSALTYLGPKTKNPGLYNVILRALMSCKQPMNTQDAQNILWTLCELQCYPMDLPLVLNHVQNILAQNMKSLERNVIIKLLSKIAAKVKSREWHYYHEGFADASASIAISEDWGITDATKLLIEFTKMGHTQISLLDYIAGKCFEDPTLLETCLPWHIAEIVHGFSAADYKPIFWDVVQAAAMSDRILQETNLQYPLSKLALSLLSLDCYCPELLTKVFKQFIGTKMYRKTDKQRMLLLHQTLATLYPQYSAPFPINDISEFIFAPDRDRPFPLLTTLKGALGGPGYVVTNVKTKLGHLIDHVVAMRKGGYPIAINDEPSNDGDRHEEIQLDDVKVPADSQIILLLYVPPYGYSINTQRLNGAWLLRIKSLEALSGHTVIPILSRMWTSLAESERTPYLMQAIRLKCDELSLTANS